MKRYFILAGVEHEATKGKWAKADDCFDVEEEPDGLFLICPNGSRISLDDLDFESKLKIIDNLENIRLTEEKSWE